MNTIDLIPPSIEENNSDSPDLKSRIIQMLTDRASGGKVRGELLEEKPLEFEYADMRISAHLRNHYDGMMIREGGALLLVMNAHITTIPNDKIVLKKVLELGSRYPSSGDNFEKICLFDFTDLRIRASLALCRRSGSTYLVPSSSGTL